MKKSIILALFLGYFASLAAMANENKPLSSSSPNNQNSEKEKPKHIPKYQTEVDENGKLKVKSPTHRSDSILVRFSKEALKRAKRDTKNGTGIPDHVVHKLNEKAKGKSKKKGKSLAKIERVIKRKAIKESNRLSRWYQVTLPDGVEVEEAIQLLNGDPEIEVVEPDLIVRSYATPNDTLSSYLWGLENINATSVWNSVQGSGDIIVAVVDSGIDYGHPDLAGNMWVNTGEIPNNQIDDDGNNYVDDVHGYDFWMNDADPMDPTGHGTHVTGTIAGVGNNNLGVTGVNWSSQVMALRFLGPNGGYISGAASAIDYAIANGAKIINHSWGGAGYSTIGYDAFLAAQDAGVLSIAAAGNAASNISVNTYTPASFQLAGMITVAAHQYNNEMSSFSNWSPDRVHLSAPGSGVLSTYKSDYAYADGTSMAAPHVTGAAALLWGSNPELTALEVKDRLLETVRPSTTLSGKVITSGYLDIAAAMAADFDAGSFKVLPNSRLVDLNSGESTSILTNVSAGLSHSGNITLSATTTTPLISTSFDSSSLVIPPGMSQSASLTVSSMANLPEGEYPVVITATDDLGETRSSFVIINVSGPGISVVASSAAPLVTPGDDVVFTLELTSTNGYAGVLTLGEIKVMPFGAGLLDHGEGLPRDVAFNLDKSVIEFVGGDTHVVTLTISTTLDSPIGYNYTAMLDMSDEHTTWVQDVQFGIWNEGIDLVSSEVWADAESGINIGEYSVLVVTDKNQGIVDSAPHYTSAYISQDSIVTQEDHYLNNIYLPDTLEAGGDRVRRGDYIKIPRSMTEGDAYIGTIVDSLYGVAESNEINNLFKDPIKVKLVNEIDYAVTDFTYAGGFPLRPGTTINLMSQVENIGSRVGHTSVELGYYLSEDPIIDNTDKLLAETFIQGWFMGGMILPPIHLTEIVEDLHEIELDSIGLSSGRYYIGAKVDSNDKQVEPNELNNAFTPIAIDIVHNVDLTLSNGRISANQINMGEIIDGNVNVHNNGTSLSNNVKVSFYLSDDATITVEDQRLYTTTIFNTLSAGEMKELVESFGVVPSAEGGYYIGAIVDPDNTINEYDESNNSILISDVNVAQSFDLAVTHVAYEPHHIAPGDSFTFDYRIENHGTGATTTRLLYWCKLMLSTDAIIDESNDTLLAGCDNSVRLKPGEGVDYTDTVTLPASLQPGSYYIGVSTGGTYETNPSNNGHAGHQVEYRTALDIAVTGVAIGQNSYGVSEALTGTVTVHNSGLDDISFSHIDLFASSDAVYSTNDQWLGTIPVENLVAGTSQDLVLDAFAIAPELTSGNYHLVAYADSKSLISETAEDNNSAASSLFSVVNNLDVTISSASSNLESAISGGPLSVTSTIKNVGTGTVGAGIVVRIHTQPNRFRDVIELGSWTTSQTLLPGGEETQTVHVTLPNNLYVTSSAVEISASADSENIIVEDNETNNQFDFWQPYTLSVDMAVTGLKINQLNVFQGDLVKIENSMTNVGKSVPIGVRVMGSHLNKVYLSDDAIITEEDRYIGEWHENASYLNEGESLSDSVSFQIDESFAPGSYYYGVILSAFHPIVDVDPSNNVVHGAQTLNIADTMASDIQTTLVKADVSSITAGGTLAIESAVYNRGEVPLSAGQSVGLYLSSDTVIEQSDIFLGEWSTSTPLSVGGYEVHSVNVTIPASVVAGNYSIGAIADYSNLVMEHDESNNALSGNIVSVVNDNFIDLAINNISSNKSHVVAGEVVSIDSTLANLGNVSVASGQRVGLYLSVDNVIDTNDVLLGEWQSIGSIAASGIENHSLTVTIPSNQQSDNYYLGAIADPAEQLVEINELNNTLAGAVITVAYDHDMLITEVSSDVTTTTTGGSLAISSRVSNAGVSTIDSGVQVNLYASTDAIIDVSDTLLGSWQTTVALSNNSTESQSVVITLPAEVSAGDYYIGAVVDPSNVISESNEVNNALAGNTVTVVNDVDLVINEITSDKVSVVAGDSVTLSSTVRNAGTSLVSSGHAVGLYLSTDAIIDSSDSLLGSWVTTTSLGNNQQESQSLTVTLPTNLSLGDYYIGAIADYSETVAETNENNNSLAGALLTITTDADLLVSAFSSDVSTMASGGTLNLSSMVTNSGTTPVPAGYSVGLYLSSDAVIDTNDTLLQQWQPLTTLQGNATESANTAVTLPSTLAAGNYYLGAIVDMNNTVTELNETNNVSSAAALTVTNQVDLSLTSVSSSVNAVAGGTLSVASTVQNSGPSTAAAGVTVNLYLSNDGVISAADTLIGSWQSSLSLAAGETESKLLVVTLPANFAMGSYTVGAIVDPLNSVLESNEDNNTLAGNSMTVAHDIDLVVNSVSSNLSSAAPGDTLLLSSNVGNTGLSTVAAGHVTGLYLSSDNIYGAGDVLLAEWSVSQALTGGNEANSTSVTLPASTAAGSYYFIAVADKNAQVAETNENNNVAVSSAITVLSGPDLVITTLSSNQASVPVEGAMTLTSTVKNIGGEGVPAGVNVGLYLSTDSVIDGTDTLLGSWVTTQLLGGNGSESNSTAITLPSTVAAGSYYLGAMADVGNALVEVNEGNNALLGSTLTVTDGVEGRDFLISQSTTTPKAGQGGTITLNYTLTNQGVLDPVGSYVYVGFYLSTDAEVTTSDIYLGAHTVSGMNAGVSKDLIKTLSLSSSQALGHYTLGIIADRWNAQEESDETNNVFSFPVEVVANDVDPTISTISTSISSSPVGQSFGVTTAVKNLGTNTLSSGTVVNYYLSTDSTISSADYLLGSRIVGSLSANANSNVTLTAPAYLDQGIYYVGAIVDPDNLVADRDEGNNVIVGGTITLTGGRDFLVSQSTTTPKAGQGGTITLNYTLTNQGVIDQAGTYVYVGFYLSTDAEVTTSDIYLGAHTVAGMHAGVSKDLIKTLSLSSSQALGHYTLGIIADRWDAQEESDETNNVFSFPVEVVANDVDPTISTISTSVSSSPVGQSFGVTTAVKNLGTNTLSSGTVVNYYLSTDSTISSADYLLGSRIVGSLSANANSNVTLTAPAYLDQGVYYVGAIVDPDNLVADRDEGNNVIVGGTITLTGGRDFLISQSTTTPKAGQGGTITLNYTLTNQGVIDPVGSYVYVGFYLSTDAEVTTSDIYLGAHTVAGMHAGVSKDLIKTLSLSSSQALGHYTLGIIADRWDAQEESDETNNVFSFPVEVVANDVDPTISTISTSVSSSPVGQSFGVTTAVKNLGTNTLSSGTVVNYYLSTDSTISSADYLLGSRTVGSLSANANSNLTLTAPAYLDQGVYYVGAIVDPDNLVADRDEGNNVIVGDMITLTGGRDFLISQSTTTPKAGQGGTITLNYTLTNQGVIDQVGSYVYVGFYLSTDAEVTTSDIYLGAHTVAGMHAGVSKDLIKTLDLSSSQALGHYTLGIIADRWDAQEESDETNNVFSFPVEVVANDVDPTISSISTSVSSSPVGQSFGVTTAVKNLGTNTLSSGTVVNYYLSTDSTISSADYLLGSQTVGSLSANVNSNVTLTAPAYLDLGSYYVGAIVDPDNLVADRDEGNNVIVGDMITLTGGRDFVITQATMSPTTVNQGGTVTVNYTLANQGVIDQVGSYVYVGFYLSTDSEVTTSDLYLGSHTVAGMHAGVSKDLIKSLSLSSSQAIGNYTIGVIADRFDAQQESDETNNVMALPLVITAP